MWQLARTEDLLGPLRLNDKVQRATGADNHAKLSHFARESAKRIAICGTLRHDNPAL